MAKHNRTWSRLADMARAHFTDNTGSANMATTLQLGRRSGAATCTTHRVGGVESPHP
jgi:hypothetical protein